ncbi:hypothetical protein [Bradyrhizobium sp. USDA 4486]
MDASTWGSPDEDAVSAVAAAALSNFIGSLVSLPLAHDIAHVGSHGLAILAM